MAIARDVSRQDGFSAERRKDLRIWLNSERRGCLGLGTVELRACPTYARGAAHACRRDWKTRQPKETQKKKKSVYGKKDCYPCVTCPLRKSQPVL